MTRHRALLDLAAEFYEGRLDEFPVWSSDAGRHSTPKQPDIDSRLADYSEAAQARRAAGLARYRERFAAIGTVGFDLDQQVDHRLFGAALERAVFADEVLKRESRDPQMYVDECLNGIFSLIKKDYAPAADRLRRATARLRAMPAFLETGKKNLARPVALYARLATESARAAEPLFVESLDALDAAAPQGQKLSAADTKALHEARATALKALSEFADWLDAKQKTGAVDPRFAMGRQNYERWLAKVALLPLSPDQIVAIGETELARSRATQAWIAPEAARAPHPAPPANQEEFLRSYEANTAGIVKFLTSHEILSIPEGIGPFSCRELPRAFKPTAPGGFMNAPGPFDTDPSGFYFIPTYDPHPSNSYLKWAIEDPRPILGHEGIPGHHYQISLANRVANPIRRLHDDGVFIEGWAFYTEEMLDRAGMYNDRPDTRVQVMQLLRMRAARVAVDVRLATGDWTFEQGVDYFMKEGGLDREAAEGETAGAAANPGYKIQYLIGKWQIQRLLGRVRDREGASFSLRRFHDRLISYGSLPVAVIEELMLGEAAEAGPS